MIRPASRLSLGSEYDAFLFAPIGEDRNGFPLSVLSALARLNVDPWEEAAQLARLPGESAIRRLLSRIETLADPPSSVGESMTLAARLIALLPAGDSSIQGPPRRRDNSWIVLYLLFTALLIGAAYLTANPSPAPGESTATAARPADLN